MYYDGANANAIMGIRASRRHGLRSDAPQHAQDVYHPARRRRRGTRAARRCRASRRLLADAGRACAKDERYRLEFDSPEIDRTDTFVLVELRPRGARACVSLRERGRRAQTRFAARGSQRELSSRQSRRVSRDAISRELPPRVRGLGATVEERARASVRSISPRRCSITAIMAPTMYFPLMVPECLMIEPTETESKETLDAFVEALRTIVDRAKTEPAALLEAPLTTPVGRVDETRAARQPDLRWRRPTSS